MIRVQTLKTMAWKNQRVWRVRRRAYALPGVVMDTDGEEDKPDTWSRWEEEHFTNWTYAYAACQPEMDGRKRRGFLDQIKAQTVLDRLERAGANLDKFDAGKYRMIYPHYITASGQVEG